MIRVLHYGLSSNAGGIETYLLNLTQRVDRSRFHFDFVYNRVGEPCFYRELTALGSRFYGITPRRQSVRKNRAELDELFEREAFDIFHCHVNTLSYVEPINAALRHDCRVVVHSHNSGASNSLVTNLLHRAHSATLPKDRVTMVAVSRMAGQWLFGPDARFTIINNGIEVDRFAFRQEARDRVRKALDIDASFVVGNVGAFLSAKNHVFLVKVFEALSAIVPEAKLVLVGLGPLEKRVRLQVADSGLTDKVLFLGRRDDIPDLLSAMDRLIFPSLYEGFPLAVLEAQVAGLPSLISDAITDEVVVTDVCKRIPLSRSPHQWAQELVAVGAGRDRASCSEAASAAGVSVEVTAERVRRLYLENMVS